MFLTVRVKRGSRAINLSEIARLDYRAGADEGSASLMLRLRSAGAGDEGGQLLRVKGAEARELWGLLHQRGLLLQAQMAEGEAATDVVHAEPDDPE